MIPLRRNLLVQYSRKRNEGYVKTVVDKGMICYIGKFAICE